jgi:hypothetical protein
MRKRLPQGSIALNLRDFEDAVQYACAIAHGLDVIVTDDVSGLVSGEIPVISPGELGNISS